MVIHHPILSFSTSNIIITTRITLLTKDLGEVNLLAVTHNTGYPAAIGAVSVINHFYGRCFLLSFIIMEGSFCYQSILWKVGKIFDYGLDTHMQYTGTI